jgi:hypothetical protein
MRTRLKAPRYHRDTGILPVERRYSAVSDGTPSEFTEAQRSFSPRTQDRFAPMDLGGVPPNAAVNRGHGQDARATAHVPNEHRDSAGAQHDHKPFHVNEAALSIFTSRVVLA